jgi:hypothetical protein
MKKVIEEIGKVCVFDNKYFKRNVYSYTGDPWTELIEEAEFDVSNFLRTPDDLVFVRCPPLLVKQLSKSKLISIKKITTYESI